MKTEFISILKNQELDGIERGKEFLLQLISVGELKLAGEILCENINDTEILLSSDFAKEITGLCKRLKLDDHYTSLLSKFIEI